MKGSAA